jgi:hypothetical protein
MAEHAADELHLDMLVAAAGEEVVEASWSPKSQKSCGIAMQSLCGSLCPISNIFSFLVQSCNR